jgi:hypothetical protein
MFMYEALECLGGGGRGRMDVVAHVACAVAVGGVSEHRAHGGADRRGVLQDPAIDSTQGSTGPPVTSPARRA